MKKLLPSTVGRYIGKRATQVGIGTAITGVLGDLINTSFYSLIQGTNWLNTLADFTPFISGKYSALEATSYDLATGAGVLSLGVGSYIWNQFSDLDERGWAASRKGAEIALNNKNIDSTIKEVEENINEAVNSGKRKIQELQASKA